MPKKIRYRRADLIIPDNISMNKVKQLINSGGDYGLTVQQIVNIFGINEKVFPKSDHEVKQEVFKRNEEEKFVDRLIDSIKNAGTPIRFTGRTITQKSANRVLEAINNRIVEKKFPKEKENLQRWIKVVLNTKILN